MRRRIHVHVADDGLLAEVGNVVDGGILADGGVYLIADAEFGGGDAALAADMEGIIGRGEAGPAVDGQESRALGGEEHLWFPRVQKVSK